MKRTYSDKYNGKYVRNEEDKDVVTRMKQFLKVSKTNANVGIPYSHIFYT